MLKLPPRILKPWFILYSIHWNFFLLRLLCISINLPYSHVWNTVVMSGLVLLVELMDKLQKQICRTVDPSLAASLESLAHQRNVTSFSLFYRYCFGRYPSELAELVPLPYCQGRSTCYSDRLPDFSGTIPRCSKMSMSAVSFLAQLSSGILCLLNVFLWPMILVALTLELTDIF